MKKEFKIVIIILFILITLLNIIQLIYKDETVEIYLYRIEIESFKQMNNNIGMYVEKECDSNFILRIDQLQVLYNRNSEQHINIYKLNYKNPIQRLFFDAGLKAEVYLQYSELRGKINE